MRAFLTILFALLAMGLPLTSHADDSREINVIPTKIILGALDFAKSEDSIMRFKFTVQGIPAKSNVTNIDCSRASGIHVVSQQRKGADVIVELVINKMQLSERQPYGAFIKKQIRIETNYPKQPQFVIPVIGWLDINNSSRDFCSFVYQGRPRWQGPWSTPNVAGAILAVVAIGLTGGSGWLLARLPKTNPVTLMLSLCLTITVTTFLLWLLGLTYSREAWLALLLACGTMVLFSAELRRPALGTIGIFAVLLCCLPSGMQRFESYTQIEGDLSIANRLKLWIGSLQMMADHPIFGVGTGGFRVIFEKNYQQFSHTAQTSSPVSDYLTIGVEHGIYLLSILLGPVILLLAWSLKLSSKPGSLPIVVFAAMLVSMLTTSCFSTLWVSSYYRGLAVITLGGLVWFSLIAEFRKREFRPFAFQVILQTSKSTLATSIFLFCVGTISLTVLPTRVSSREIIDRSALTFQYDEISPRWVSPKGTIIYLASLSNVAMLYHSTLRPIAAMGWRVIPISSSADPTLVHELIKVIRQEPLTGKIFVAGEANGGKLAWKIAAESPEIVEAGGGYDFLSADMDDPGEKTSPSQPFLVYQSLYSDGASSDPAICARNQVAFRGLPLTVVLSGDSPSHFSMAWIMYLTTLSIFFEYELRR